MRRSPKPLTGVRFPLPLLNAISDYEVLEIWIIGGFSNTLFLFFDKTKFVCGVGQIGKPIPRMDFLLLRCLRLEEPIPQIDFNPQEWGVPIKNGEILEIEITDESVKTVFVIINGILSNEILLEPQAASYQVLVTTKGGWAVPCYPVLTVEADKRENEYNK